MQDVASRSRTILADERPAEATPARVPRPPIVTVMGHVDHGKTSLLDAIRKTNVVAGEAGGITQHIGAYQARVGETKLTFIDTPGHAAFTAMRARGAQLTDIVVLVVAATEGVMPQTIEAIDHARRRGCRSWSPINKCDLPGANPQQTRQRLMEHGLVPEDFGGETICVNVSATKGTGLDQLLEMLSLQADVLELRGRSRRGARAASCSRRSSTRGAGRSRPCWCSDGTLRRGDMVVVGTVFGRVRAMEDENGAARWTRRCPSTPVQVIGLSGVPEAGAPVHAVESERVAKDIIDHRVELAASARRGGAHRAQRSRSSSAQAESGGVKELPIVLKADVHGSVEALRDALLKLSTDAVKVNVMHSGVGAVTETRRDAGQGERRDRGRLPRAPRAGGAPRRRGPGRRDPHLSDHLRGRATRSARRWPACCRRRSSEKFLGRAEVRAHLQRAARSARSPAATSPRA